MNFLQKLDRIQEKNNSLVCVGLDPDPQKFISTQSIFEFNKSIIESTYEFVCAYKPQIAFYAAHGLEALAGLMKTIDYIRKNYPQMQIILDAKRGDVPNTSKMYAKELFDVFTADAATVSPYYGFDALEPFFERDQKGVFVICRTSNPGASEIQDLQVEGKPLYVKVAENIVNWSKNYNNVMLEIGATWPEQIRVLRKLAPDMNFLIAGIGAQKGDLKGTINNGLRSDKRGLIVSSSRGIIYAKNPQKAAKDLRDEINSYR